MVSAKSTRLRIAKNTNDQPLQAYFSAIFDINATLH